MSESTPICRCRVLYLGSAVPRQSKDGLQGIQEPLRSLYPPEGAVGVKGIDSWLSVWSNGILMENVDENLQNITRFFPIESLHYCAAVRHVLIPDRSNSNSDPKFLPLDSPFAHMPRVQHPPIFSAILRRTTGIKVLECHAFICKREAAANALVRCCFHAYADNSYVQQLEVCSRKSDNCGSIYGTLTIDPTYNTEKDSSSKHLMKNNLSSRNAENLNELSNTNMDVKDGDGISDCAVFLNNSGDSNGMEGYTSVKNFYGSSGDLNATADEIETFSGANGNHKVWNGFTEEENNANIDSSHEYAVYNTTSMSRPIRPRQISAPINVQPPPFKEESNAIIKQKKHAGAYESQSLSGTLIRAKHSPQHSTSSGLYEPTMNQVFHRQMVQRFGSKHFNFIRQNIFKGGLIKDPYQHPPCYSRFHVLMPPLNSRPMYPEYATLHSFACPKKQKKKTQNCSRSPNSTPCLSYDNLTRANPSKLKQVIGQSPVVDLKQVAIEKKELPNSLGGSLDENATQGVDSLGGTGIYRRRGHLNERAFSYSIRQEHRSRSHGSLAGLKFSPPETNKDVASEQDISQIVAALKISEHEKKKHEGL